MKKEVVKKAQVSMEFMIIIGFSMLVIMPVIVLFFSNYQSLADNVYVSHASKAARTIMNSAEKVYYIGEPAQSVIKINMPERVDEVLIGGNYIIFKVRFDNSVTDVYETASMNVTGSISATPGIKNILVQAHDDYVNITET